MSNSQAGAANETAPLSTTNGVRARSMIAMVNIMIVLLVIVSSISLLIRFCLYIFGFWIWGRFLIGEI